MTGTTSAKSDNFIRRYIAQVTRPLKIVGYEWGMVAGFLFFQFSSTIFESVGLSMLLPVYQLMESGKTAAELASQSRLWEYLLYAYTQLGLEPTIPVLLATSFVAIVMRQAFIYFRLIFVARTRFTLIRRLRERAFNAYLLSRLDHVEQSGFGSVLNDLTTEMQLAVECAMAIVTSWGLIVVCTVYLALLFVLSPGMTLAAILVIGVAAIPVIRLTREGRRIGREIVHTNAALLNFITERLKSIRLIRLSGTGSAEIQTMGSHAGRQFEKYMRGFVLQSRVTVLMEPIIAAAIFAFLYFGINQLGLELGMIGLFLLIVLRLVPVIKEVLAVRYAILHRLGSAEQIEQRLEGLDAAREEETGTLKFEQLSKEIRFRDVNFSYKGQKVPALSGVSCRIPRSRITALVGPSGSGKSTLIDLLPRLREPTKGEIFFDGTPARDFRLESLRNAISYAPQSPQIFDGSPLEHISYGAVSPKRKDIEEAARLAGAHDFITQLPEGYDTKLYEGGARLSGGQRQRLDLARALYGDASILILDEPTSQLDADSEHAFREALERVRAETDLTIIVVAHRLSTVSIADQIIVLRNGKVENSGTHAKLLKAGGWYANAYKKQQIGGRTRKRKEPAE